ncbi:hypothetical protein HK405_013449, partial [Cladochytrium tenue]
MQEEQFIERYGSQPFLRLEQVVVNASDSKLLYDNGRGRGVLSKDMLMRVLDLQRRLSETKVNASDFHHLEASFAHAWPAATAIGLEDICYKPFPDGRCLVHSMLEYWHSSADILSEDDDILSTLSNSSKLSSFGTPIPLHSVLGGVTYESPTSHPRHGSGRVSGAASIVITYFLELKWGLLAESEEWTTSVWNRLWEAALLSEETLVAQGQAFEIGWRSEGEVRHLYYAFDHPNDFISAEFVILCISYLLVFLYISLVLGRVELVKSKFGLGFSAVLMRELLYISPVPQKESETRSQRPSSAGNRNGPGTPIRRRQPSGGPVPTGELSPVADERTKFRRIPSGLEGHAGEVTKVGFVPPSVHSLRGGVVFWSTGRDCTTKVWEVLIRDTSGQTEVQGARLLAKVVHPGCTATAFSGKHLVGARRCGGAADDDGDSPRPSGAPAEPFGWWGVWRMDLSDQSPEETLRNVACIGDDPLCGVDLPPPPPARARQLKAPERFGGARRGDARALPTADDGSDGWEDASDSAPEFGAGLDASDRQTDSSDSDDDEADLPVLGVRLIEAERFGI